MNGRSLLDLLTGGTVTRTEETVAAAQQALDRAQMMLTVSTVASVLSVLLLGYLVLTQHGD